MPLVATLVSSPTAAQVTPALVADAARALRGTPRILAASVAAEFAFEGEAAAAEADLRALVAGLPVDVAVQPAEFRRKRLLLADMDSTMIGQECIDELAAELGLKAEIAAITERAMHGEIAFEPALRERVALLKGLDAGVIDRVIAERITLTPGAETLIATMRAAGAYCALVSGGFSAFTSVVGGRIGFNEHRSNTLHVAEGRLAGTVAEPILGRAAKVEALIELRDRLGLQPQETMAVGDGANDLGMIQEAGTGVAYHAKPKVAAEADIRIDHADLTALLYIQGYAAAEFAR